MGDSLSQRSLRRLLQREQGNCHRERDKTCKHKRSHAVGHGISSIILTRAAYDKARWVTNR
jgi:hypothetical protein